MAKSTPEPEKKTPAAVDPARAAFLAALEKKKQRGNSTSQTVLGAEKTEARKSGPDAGRRMFQRRAGSA